MAKMNKKWVFLCSTAIGAIYTAGYFATETQATIQQLQQQVQVKSQPKSSQPQQQAQVKSQPKSSQPQQQAQVNTQTESSQPKRLYKDGVFKGTGTNRRGSIQVAVTVKSDKITDVEISHFAMHYSEDDVVHLPQEAVQKQSAQVQNVSGATYSTQAFKDAIQDALSQARNS
ncbi:FMN-binding protein [Paenibacillus sp. GCM10027628]|uniref:FMN-binding protein n=1 Tax=Paenibacillus sp. GCM10027628 TaxID=3273413 RepID=UPI00363186D7